MECRENTEKMKISEKIKQQIVNGCGGTLCTGIFCKLSDIEGIVEEIASLLLEYGDYFTCESLYFIHGRIAHEEEDSRYTMQIALHPNMSTTLLPQVIRNIDRETKLQSNLDKTESKNILTTNQSVSAAKSILRYFYLHIRGNGHMSHTLSPFIQGIDTYPSKRSLFSPYILQDEELGIGLFREENLEKEYLHMELARIIHRKKRKSTAIMLQGMFYHELNRVRMSYSVQNTIRAIKLFNAVKESVKFEKKYFIRFLEAVEKLCEVVKAENILCMDQCNKMFGGLSYKNQPECGFREEEEFRVSRTYIPHNPIPTKHIEECVICHGSMQDCEYPHCDALCYRSKKVCVNELIDLIKSLIIVIDNTSVVNMREGTLLLAILKGLRGLYKFSVETGIVHHSIFINKRFSRLLNYKVEVKYHKEGSPSIFDFPFILDMPAKSDLIQIENTDRMKAELQDAFFRSLFEGKIPPYLSLEVDRESVVQDSLKLLESLEKGMAWKQLKIKFHGEDGIDSGGIKKEFFQILSQKTLGEWDIFKEEEGILWFNTFSSEGISLRKDKYKILGIILGLAAYNGAVLCFYFPQVFYKRLLGYSCTFDDLKIVEPKVHKTLSDMRSMGRDEIESLSLEYTVDGVVKSVSSWNLEEFIEVYSKEILEVRLQPVFNLIKDGLWSICGDTFIRSLLPCELSILIGGMECLNMEEIEKYTVYNGYRRDSEFVQAFWDIFRSYDRTMQKKFLRFVTGTDRAPSGGISRMALVFMRNGGDTDRLPSSQTCFNTFLVPEYSDKKKLKEKLDLAISHTEGFFLL